MKENERRMQNKKSCHTNDMTASVFYFSIYMINRNGYGYLQSQSY